MVKRRKLKAVIDSLQLPNRILLQFLESYFAVVLRR